jgi:hypothetical protein
MSKHNNDRPCVTRGASAAETGEEYKVGPRRPPREYRFKPGQSGNPKGAKPKAPSLAPGLKQLLERALSKTVTLKQGERQQIVTMASAGIEQLVAQFAKGDRHARRDLFWLADKLGVDLMNGGRKAFEEALASNHQAILSAYVERQYDKVVTRSPVLAPPELLDDDHEDKSEK